MKQREKSDKNADDKFSSAQFLKGHSLQILCDFFQCGFFDTGNVGAGNAEEIRGLPLRDGLFAVQSVAEHDDLPLSRLQHTVNDFHDAAALKLAVEILRNGVIHADDIAVGQRSAVLVGVDGLADGDLVGKLLA